MATTWIRPFPAQRRQRGVAMLEALIAFLVLSVGLLALSRLQTGLRTNADAARERSEAVRLAQTDIEGLRAFANSAAWEAIADASSDVTPAGSRTHYTLERVVRTSADPALKAVEVTLQWNDRHGAAQQLQLSTLIASQDPALSAALTLPRPRLTHP